MSATSAHKAEATERLRRCLGEERKKNEDALEVHRAQHARMEREIARLEAAKTEATL